MPGAERRHRKKTLKPAIKRELVNYLTTQFTMGIRQACRTLSLSRTVYFYQPDALRDEPVIHALTELAERYPRYGFKKLFQLLRRQGNTWNHKRVHRFHCLLKLNFRRKGKQRLPVRNPAPLATPEALNQSWSIDLMHDALTCGRRFRTFNVVDDFNREALAIEISLNIPAQRVVRGLDRIVANRGYPLKMRMDNGPELISLALAQWAEDHGVMLDFIKPGTHRLNGIRGCQYPCGSSLDTGSNTTDWPISSATIESPSGTADPISPPFHSGPFLLPLLIQHLRPKSTITIAGHGKLKSTGGRLKRFSGRAIFAVGFNVLRQVQIKFSSQCGFG